MWRWSLSLKIAYTFNAFSILTKHLSGTVSITFAFWGVTAKLAQISFPCLQFHGSKVCFYCGPWQPQHMTFFFSQFSSVAQSCPTLCNPMNRSTPGLLVHHHLPEFNQTHVHWVRDAIQPSYPWSSPSPPAPNPSQHQSLFQWVNSSHEVSEVLELQL